MSSNKIVLLTSEFPPQPGGIGNHAYNLAEGLQEHNFKVTVITDTRSKSGAPEKQFDRSCQATIVRISRKNLVVTYFKRIAVAFKYVKQNDTLIASGKFSLWVGAFLSLFISRKYIAVIHGSELQLGNQFLKIITNTALKQFHTVIAVSNYTKSLVSHLDLNNIHVIHNGFTLQKPMAVAKKHKPLPVLITVGNVTARKGQHNVIKALPQLLKIYPDLQYHIVGIPTEKERLQKLALDLNVEQAVYFHGCVSEDEKIRLLQQADVFMMLSETTKTGDAEGFGIAILEANSLGIPAIGARNCGIEDAIKDKSSGRLIVHNDPLQCKEALEDILEKYQTYANNATSWSKQFSWDKIVKKYIEVLN